jgi:alanine-synthesizing transaminase
VAALARMKSYHDYGTFTPLQVAAIAALEGDQQCVRDIAAKYQQRRDVLVKGLNELAGKWNAPRLPCISGRASRSSGANWVRWSLPA